MLLGSSRDRYLPVALAAGEGDHFDSCGSLEAYYDGAAARVRGRAATNASSQRARRADRRRSSPP
ncbi:MAG: hypothetical protein M0T80_05010, partial [Actinomycetota bacterium]|nr:hypothetical protein [Actinomycetota bacterium]